MYFSINYTNNNLYLYKHDNRSNICKKNFSYQLSNNHYNKIVFLTTHDKNSDILKIYIGDQHTPLSFNTNWSINHNYLIQDSFIKNILIPPSKDIELQDNYPDITTINSLCQEFTNITKLPNVKCLIKDKEFLFNKWTGFSQIWCSSNATDEYTAYAYLYFLRNKTILMVSITEKNIEHNDVFDLDFMSTSYHEKLTHDEFNRIDCLEHRPQFTDVQILQHPLNLDIANHSIEITTEYE